MNLADKIKANMQNAINFKMLQLKELAEQDFRDAIQQVVYSRPESDWYHRTYGMLNSVKTSDIITEGNIISFKVYLDPNKMHHTSIAGETAKGIAPGEEIYLPPLIEYGHSGLNVDYPATYFLEEFIKELEIDLRHSMVQFLIKKSNPTDYRK